jgi:hypothetical protein
VVTADRCIAAYAGGAVVTSGTGVGADTVVNTVTVPGVPLLLEPKVEVVVKLEVREGVGPSSAVGGIVGPISSVAVAVRSPVGSGVIVSTDTPVAVTVSAGVGLDVTVTVPCPSTVVGTGVVDGWAVGVIVGAEFGVNAAPAGVSETGVDRMGAGETRSTVGQY